MCIGENPKQVTIFVKINCFIGTVCPIFHNNTKQSTPQEIKDSDDKFHDTLIIDWLCPVYFSNDPNKFDDFSVLFLQYTENIKIVGLSPATIK